ncbi:ECF-type sigma factor [Wenzhouxiangella sp. EGI_FJ10305]|uniref:ECF-type sigma factor n=1 Tax=Wenzhouxiangella sp. EGI_FJ10305 TaxID=3243768 RepID=UPI0035E1F481
MAGTKESIGELIQAHRSGDSRALERLIEKLYFELRELAHVQVRRNAHDSILDTTALVNELYCKLAENEEHDWRDRQHFFATCATAMRHLLVDSARRKQRDKRGGGASALTLNEDQIAAGTSPEWIIELDRLMDELARRDSRLVQVFECRYFCGLSVAETARILELSERTIERDYARARAWLRQAFKKPPGQVGT